MNIHTSKMKPFIFHIDYMIFQQNSKMQDQSKRFSSKILFNFMIWIQFDARQRDSIDYLPEIDENCAQSNRSELICALLHLILTGSSWFNCQIEELRLLIKNSRHASKESNLSWGFSWRILRNSNLRRVWFSARE